MLGKLDSNGTLKKGDIILDGGNECYRATERRQKSQVDKSVVLIGVGVSGGYKSARRGPSMSPGGDEATVRLVLPLLEQFAAKYKRPDGVEKPCMEYIGPGGLDILLKWCITELRTACWAVFCESWSFMSEASQMGNDEIGKVCERGNEKGDLEGDIFASDSK